MKRKPHNHKKIRKLQAKVRELRKLVVQLLKVNLQQTSKKVKL